MGCFDDPEAGVPVEGAVDLDDPAIGAAGLERGEQGVAPDDAAHALERDDERRVQLQQLFSGVLGPVLEAALGGDVPDPAEVEGVGVARVRRGPEEGVAVDRQVDAGHELVVGDHRVQRCQLAVIAPLERRGAFADVEECPERADAGARRPDAPHVPEVEDLNPVLSKAGEVGLVGVQRHHHEVRAERQHGLQRARARNGGAVAEAPGDGVAGGVLRDGDDPLGFDEPQQRVVRDGAERDDPLVGSDGDRNAAGVHDLRRSKLGRVGGSALRGDDGPDTAREGGGPHREGERRDQQRTVEEVGLHPASSPLASSWASRNPRPPPSISSTP